MADLAQGYHANVVLQPNEALRVESDGTTTVQALYGAPDGTTTLTSQSQTFGPYGVPAKLKVLAVSGGATYQLYEPPVLSSDDGSIVIATTDDHARFAVSTSAVNPRSNVNDPWGAGNLIKLKPGMRTLTAGATLHTANSLASEAGSAACTLEWAGYPPPGGPYPGGPTGILTIGSERLLKDTIVARGENRHIELHGRSINNPLTTPENLPYPIHGIFAPEAENGIIQSFDYCRVTGAPGDGFHIVGRDQLISRRMKAGNNRGWGINLEDVGDSKLWGTGSSGGSGDNRGEAYKSTGGALRIAHCATFSMMQFDLFVDESTFAGPANILLEDQTNARFVAGEMSGPVAIVGRNYQNGGNEYEINNSTFAFVLFKWAQGILAPWTFTRPGGGSTVAVNAYVLVDDADGLEFLKPKFGGIDPEDVDEMALRPDYLWQFASRQDTAHKGYINVVGGAGLFLRMSRLGDSKTQEVPFKKHWAPVADIHRVNFGFPIGALEDIPWDDANPPLTHVKAGPFGGAPATYNKADYKYGYLFATAHNVGGPGTLDDGITTFQVPAADLPARIGRAWAMRVVPF